MKKLLIIFFFSLLANASFAQRTAREYFIIGNDFFKQGDVEMSIRAYNRAIELDSNVADYFFSRGASKTYFVNLDALEDYNKAIKLDSLNDVYYFNRGHYWFDKEEYEKAFEDYYKATLINPSIEDYFFSTALTRVELGDKEGAVLDFNSAILLDSTRQEFYLHRARAFNDLDLKIEALDDFQKAMSFDPFYAEAIYYTALFLHQEMNKYDEAIKLFTRLTKLDPTELIYYSKRGDVKYDKGDFRGAAKDYSIAIAWDKTDAYSYFCRGLAKFARGKNRGACKDWRRAERLEFEPATEKLKEFCK